MSVTTTKAARLPSSLITLIASHLTSKVGSGGRSVPCLSRIAPRVPYTLEDELPGVPRPSSIPLADSRVELGDETRRALASVRKSIRSSLVANTRPLTLAHQVLNTHFAPSVCSSTTALLFRQRLYSNIIYSFLRHQHPVTPIFSLLRRSIQEGIPIATKTLTQVLRLAIDNGAGREAVMQILPVLPDEVDVHLLTLLLHAVLRSAAPPVEELEQIIVTCLDARGIKTEDEWPLEVWDVLMSAHARHLDFRGGATLLGRYKQAIARPSALEKTQLATLPGLEPEVVTRPYTTLMALWTTTRFVWLKRGGPRLSSAIPARLAEDLESVLDCDPPLEFMIAWMNAERVAGDIHAASAVWERIAGWKPWSPPPVSSCPASTLPSHHNSRPSLPTRSDLPTSQNAFLARSYPPVAEAYSTLFKLYKPSSSPPPRRSIGHFLSTSKAITTNALNSAISSTLGVHTRDLPLAYLLLDRFTHGVFPDERTVDVVAAGLIRARRRGIPIFALEDEERVLRSSTTSRGAASGFRAGQGVRGAGLETRQRPRAKELHEGLTLAEWDLVSHALHRLRRTPDGDERLLPVGKPLARLTEERMTVAVEGDLRYQTRCREHAHREEGSNGVASMMSGNSSDPLQHCDTRQYTPVPSARGKEDAKELLLPLKQLLQRAIVLDHARKPGMQYLTSDVVFKKVIAEAEADIYG